MANELTFDEFHALLRDETNDELYVMAREQGVRASKSMNEQQRDKLIRKLYDTRAGGESSAESEDTDALLAVESSSVEPPVLTKRYRVRVVAPSGQRRRAGRGWKNGIHIVDLTEAELKALKKDSTFRVTPIEKYLENEREKVELLEAAHAPKAEDESK